MATAQPDTLMRYIKELAAGGAGHRTDRQLLDDFEARGDEQAFAGLVDRYGPLVLRVCRRVLQHEQDAEDAYQATFLVLARHPGSIRRREALASWLHGVAYRTAMKAKRSAARRRNHEAQLRDRTPPAAPSPTWDDVQVVLDEEIQRLPDLFRSAFVLCILDGKTVPAAAIELGVKEGTLSWRLARARQRLRQRLVRRGIQLSAVLAALSLVNDAGRAAVSTNLATGTIRFGLLVATGEPAAGLIPTHIAALAAGVTRAMFLSKAKIATTVLLVVSVLTGAGILVREALAGKPAAPQTAATEPPASKPQVARARKEIPRPVATQDDAQETVTFSGRVLDPDGMPVKGAKLYITLYHNFKLQSLPVRAKSGDGGKYRFTVPKAEFNKTLTTAGEVAISPEPWKYALVLAMAEGYALGLPQVDFQKPLDPLPIDDLTIHLARDDMPIDGRVLDLQARPVPGVKVRVRGIQWPVKGDLSSYLSALKSRKEGFHAQQELLTGIRHPYRGWDLDSLYPPVITAADGRFRIRGVGRERIADLLIEGPAIETKYVYAMTRPSETIDVPYRKNQEAPLVVGIPRYTHYGATFDHVAPPSTPITGVVRDRETGKPIPGAVLRGYQLAGNLSDDRVRFRVMADREGRYRITGMPYARGNQFQVAGPPDGPAYVMAIKEVGTSPALEPIAADIELQRGVWVTGKVTDKATGQPVACQVDYFAFEDNPYLKDGPGFTTGPQDDRIAEDGAFRIAVLPGRGAIAVHAMGMVGDPYVHGVGREKITGAKDVPEHSYFKASPYFFYPDSYHAVAEINPDKNASSLTCNLVLDPGRTLSGTILGPDGKPLAGGGAVTHGMSGRDYWSYEPLKTAAFTVSALKPGEARRLLVVHKEKHLAGTLLLRGDEKGPLTIQLQPWGVAMGKLVAPEGKNPADYRIMTLNGTVFTAQGVEPRDLDAGSMLQPVNPDKDGNFRIEGLVPGLKYNLLVGKGNYISRITGSATRSLTVKSGETKDLGEIHAERIDE